MQLARSKWQLALLAGLAAVGLWFVGFSEADTPVTETSITSAPDPKQLMANLGSLNYRISSSAKFAPGRNVTDVTRWGEFARAYDLEYESLRESISAVTSQELRLNLLEMLAATDRVFQAVAANADRATLDQHETEFHQSKAKAAATLIAEERQ